MSQIHIHPRERRALGWYALHWTHLTDWFSSNKRYWQAATHIMASRNQALPKPRLNLADGDTSHTEEQKLQDVVRDTHSILAQASSVFPLMIFPDSITVDRQKLTIVYKKFFNTQQTVSVPLENVKNIQSDIGPFFGSLTITSDLFINNTQTINFLRRSDVKVIQKLVQGATNARSEGIDISKIETAQLKHLLIELGEGHTDLLDK